MQSFRVVFVSCILALTGCGDNAPGSEPGQGGTHSTGGGTYSPGGSISSGNTSTLPSTGGNPQGTGGAATSNSGGTLVSGGTSAQGSTNVSPGEPCTSNCPTGKIIKCFGDGCANGECDDALFFADKLCSELYPSAIDANTAFCAANESGSYCLATLGANLNYQVVRCNNGSPTVEHCPAACGFSSTGAKC